MSGIVYERIANAVVNGGVGRGWSDFRIASTELRPQRRLAIIDGQILTRQNLQWGLLSHRLGLRTSTYGSIEEIEPREAAELSIILVCTDDISSGDNLIFRDIEALVQKFPGVPVLVRAEGCGLQQIQSLLEQGACGCLPTNAGLSVCMEAISMALAGGVFIAAESLQDMQLLLGSRRRQPKRKLMFTPRERDVIEALRQGKANKTIAYALNLAPNTVKVHVGHILKKLRATNRTEAIYKINAAMFDETV
jgi:DNA-binding NarL/FixJ family response regulator